MIKELLHKQEGVGALTQGRYRCLSNLPSAQKKGVCRSWIRGSGSEWISCYHKISEDEVRACTEELYQMASNLGKKTKLLQNWSCSDGLVYLVGEMLQHWNVGELRKEIGFTITQLNALRDRYNFLTGIPPKKALPKDRKYFKYVRPETTLDSPYNGVRMRVLDTSLQMSKELAFEKMSFDKVGDIYYCMDSSREFFPYEGDENGNPCGLYEIAHEYID